MTAKKTSSETTKTVKKTEAKKVAVKKKAPTKKTSTKKAPAKKTPAKKAPAKKAPAKKAPVKKKAPAKKAPAKKAPAKKAPAKKTPSKKTPSKKSMAKNPEVQAEVVDKAVVVETQCNNVSVQQPHTLTVVDSEPATETGEASASKDKNTVSTPDQTLVLSDRARALMCMKRRKKRSPMLAFRNKLDATYRTVKKIAATFFML